MTAEQGLSWDDPELVEGGDNGWTRGCRWLQMWWRQEVLLSPSYGTRSKEGVDDEEPRFVGSMLPADAEPTDNFLDPLVSQEVDLRLRQRGWGGLIAEDRLRRNLLSSQPAAFNAFGFLKHHPRVLLEWLKSIGIEAAQVEVRMEWAPPQVRHLESGSAFDAAVFYTTVEGKRGLVGVELKYAENLAAQRITARDRYLTYTRSSGNWRAGAEDRLAEPRLAQLWLNTLLAQSCVEKNEEGITEATVVMTACAADRSAFDAAADVRREIVSTAGWVAWSPFESLLNVASGFDELAGWVKSFRQRYLDFAPIARMLDDDDPRLDSDPHATRLDEARTSFGASVAQARSMAERVLGDGSILEQVADGRSSDVAGLAAMARELDDLSERLRLSRERAYPTWAGLPPSVVVGSPGERLAAHCVDVLGDPSEWKPAPGYRSLALCVIDSIWSMGIRYIQVVVPLIERYRSFRSQEGGDADTDSLGDLLAVYERVGDPDRFANDVVDNRNLTSSRSGILKAEAVAVAAASLSELGLTTVERLRAANPEQLAHAEQTWRRVRGQSSGISWTYMLMLAGFEGVKLDRMVRRFIADALGYGPDETAISPTIAGEALSEAFEVLQQSHPDLSLRALDRTIWGHQTGVGGVE